MDVEGRITTNLNLGDIDDDIEALVVPELNDHMVLRLRSMNEYKCCLNFCCDELWTGPTEGSEVPVRYVTPELVPRKLPTIPPDPGGQTEPNSFRGSQMCERQVQGSSRNCGSTNDAPENLPGIYENQHVRVIQEEDEKVQADWATDDKNDSSEDNPEVVSLQEALRRCTPTGKT